MATPPRLVELQCPCGASHWEIDHDVRMGFLAAYEDRTYRCPSCRFRGPGFGVLQKSPPAFLLQSRTQDMTDAEFNKWLEILRKHFPFGILYHCFHDHPQLEELRKGLLPKWRYKGWVYTSAVPRALQDLWLRDQQYRPFRHR